MSISRPRTILRDMLASLLTHCRGAILTVQKPPAAQRSQRLRSSPLSRASTAPPSSPSGSTPVFQASGASMYCNIWVLWSRGIQWMVATHYTHGRRLVHHSATRLWLCGAEIYTAPNAAFNIYDGGDAIGCAYVAKLSVLGTSWINAHASVCAVGYRAENIQWGGTVQ